MPDVCPRDLLDGASGRDSDPSPSLRVQLPGLQARHGGCKWEPGCGFCVADADGFHCGYPPWRLRFFFRFGVAHDEQSHAGQTPHSFWEAEEQVEVTAGWEADGGGSGVEAETAGH